MPTKGTKHRNIRVPDAVWDAAKIRATERGETVSGVVNAALVEYVTRTEEDAGSGQPR
jgi:hypothetical protein